MVWEVEPLLVTFLFIEESDYTCVPPVCIYCPGEFPSTIYPNTSFLIEILRLMVYNSGLEKQFLIC